LREIFYGIDLRAAYIAGYRKTSNALEGHVAQKNQIKLFLHDESGVTAIEYSLISAVMALALIPALQYTSGTVGGLYQKIVDLFAQV
jgi:Flp pilus assembly pilin Flp